MKKMAALLLAMSLAATLASCGNNEITSSEADTSAETTVTETTMTEATTAEATTASAETTEATTAEETTEQPPVVEERTGEFDESNIVFSFAAISDVHIEGESDAYARKFVSALKQLKAEAAKNDADGIDAVCVVGDLINNGYSGNYDQTYAFKNLYESVFDPTEVPMIYTIGNHDPAGWWTAATAIEAKNISSRFGENYFLTDVDKEILASEECRHCIVNGYHILSITPCSGQYSEGVNYTPAAKRWLEQTLADITAENPEQYVMLLTHPMIYDTVYGSDLGVYWYTKDLTDILNKYPQVVTFGGHLHFPLNDPRSIMQTGFTSFGCASVRYMAIESGNYENMAGSTTMKDKDEYSQGLLIQLDKNGNLRATRMDFYNEATIDEPWEISYPTADGAHLTKYSKARGDETQNEAPVFTSVEIVKDATTGVAVNFEAADDEFVHHYAVTVKAKSRSTTRNILTDFYRHPQISDMTKSYSLSLGTLAKGTYTIEIVAYDSWGAASETYTETFEVQ